MPRGLYPPLSGDSFINFYERSDVQTGAAKSAAALFAVIGSGASDANRSLSSSHRTTARGTLVLALTVLLALLVGTAAAGSMKTPTTIVFPVLATATYTDDFGDPRPGGAHQGIDMVAPKRSLALAVEAGTVEFWTTSRSAGCMLYLHGQSGTTYYYIHLNNDLTAKNDNRGKCVAGTAYARG